MFGTHDLALFALSSLFLAITPGPDTLYIVGRSSAQGWKSGAVAAFGIGIGIFVHIFAAALGLSAILSASATAFIVVKWIGAAYLIYIGVSLFFARSSPTANVVVQPPVSLRRIFAEGFLTNVLNPKVALFFLAFLPQFIDTTATNKPFAFLFLGIVFNVIGTAWNLFTAWSSARIGDRLRNETTVTWVNRTLGGFFIFLGIRLAAAKLS